MPCVAASRYVWISSSQSGRVSAGVARNTTSSISTSAVSPIANADASAHGMRRDDGTTTVEASGVAGDRVATTESATLIDSDHRPTEPSADKRVGESGQRNHPAIPFERYADDVICHCRSEEQARTLRASLETRFAECGLTLHPDKTKVVYCKDDDRRGDYPDQKFDFLGYTFRPRLSRRRNGFGVSFSPAVSGKALKSIRQTVRHWILHERSDKTLDDLARMFNNHIRGWINYYGRFYKSALYPALRHIDRILARWAHRKFKSLRRHKRRTHHWLLNIVQRQPDLFAHWRLLYGRGRTMGAG